MIDFKNATFAKLSLTDDGVFLPVIRGMLTDGEAILKTFKGIRDGVVLTNKRIIAINVQGVTGKKKDVSSLPYSKIQAYSVETAGTIDLDSELEIWMSGLGKVKFEFLVGTDIFAIGKIISDRVL